MNDKSTLSFLMPPFRSYRFSLYHTHSHTYIQRKFDLFYSMLIALLYNIKHVNLTKIRIHHQLMMCQNGHQIYVFLFSMCVCAFDVYVVHSNAAAKTSGTIPKTEHLQCEWVIYIDYLTRRYSLMPFFWVCMDIFRRLHKKSFLFLFLY